MIEKTWLLQKSITQLTAGFEVFVNKKHAFNCSINDAGTTIFFDMRKKTSNIKLTVFEQNFAFEKISLGMNFRNIFSKNWKI